MDEKKSFIELDISMKTVQMEFENNVMTNRPRLWTSEDGNFTYANFMGPEKGTSFSFPVSGEKGKSFCRNSNKEGFFTLSAPEDWTIRLYDSESKTTNEISFADLKSMFEESRKEYASHMPTSVKVSANLVKVGENSEGKPYAKISIPVYENPDDQKAVFYQAMLVDRWVKPAETFDNGSVKSYYLNIPRVNKDGEKIVINATVWDKNTKSVVKEREMTPDEVVAAFKENKQRFKDQGAFMAAFNSGKFDRNTGEEAQAAQAAQAPAEEPEVTHFHRGGHR